MTLQTLGGFSSTIMDLSRLKYLAISEGLNSVTSSGLSNSVVAPYAAAAIGLAMM